MYRPDGSRTKGLTSSVTAAMRSPKVVLITFCLSYGFLLDAQFEWISLRFKISRHRHCSLRTGRI